MKRILELLSLSLNHFSRKWQQTETVKNGIAERNVGLIWWWIKGLCDCLIVDEGIVSKGDGRGFQSVKYSGWGLVISGVNGRVPSGSASGRRREKSSFYPYRGCWGFHKLRFDSWWMLVHGGKGLGLHQFRWRRWRWVGWHLCNFGDRLECFVLKLLSYSQSLSK